MTAEMMLGIVVGLVALAMAAYTMHRQRHLPESREAQLERQVGELTVTVRSLLATDRDRQKRIEALEQDLAQTQLQLSQARGEIARLQERLARYEGGGNTGAERLLLVGTGKDAALGVDLAALRGVRGLRITRLHPLTYTSLKATLERARRQGRPIELLHMAVHAREEGIEMERLVRRDELSEVLRDVLVLVIMGCRSAVVADLLTVVPAVVAFREDVPHDEAWQWALVFWRAVGDGLKPDAAFEQALDRGPVGIGEYAELLMG